MLTIEYAKEPKYITANNKAIFLIVKFAEFQEELPFNATEYDVEPWGVELYNRAKSGEFGKVAPYEEQSLS